MKLNLHRKELNEMAAIMRTQKKMGLEEQLLTHISNATDAQLTAMTWASFSQKSVTDLADFLCISKTNLFCIDTYLK